MSVWVYLGVGALGAVGTLARYGFDAVVQRAANTGFPFGTLAVNVTGSFALGLLVGLAVVGDTLVLAGTGLLGSFTTFSTWMLETERLAEDDRRLAAVINLGGGLAAGLVAAGAGWALGSLL